MEEQEKSYDEKVEEVKSAPGEGAGWESDADEEPVDTERAEK